MNNKKGEIIFIDALGHWKDAIIDLFDMNKNNIVKWDINFNDFDKLEKCTELADNKNELKRKGNKNPEDNLYIFIAPLTWASRYQKCGFKILGPAFGTNDSLSVFAGKYNYDTDKTIRVGTIGKYITSTALFLVYHLFMEHIFDSNIHLISQNGVTNRKEKINFEFIDEFTDNLDRYEKLKNKDSDIDYAIFTSEDIMELNLDEEESEIREVLKVDPVLSHIFNIKYVPRTVYCIHESQKNLKELIKDFHKILVKNKKNYNKPLNKNSGNRIVYPIDPEDSNAQKIQNLIIKYFVQMLKEDAKIDNIKTIEEFRKIAFTKINEIEK